VKIITFLIGKGGSTIFEETNRSNNLFITTMGGVNSL
jgi:hypothetical protein